MKRGSLRIKLSLWNAAVLSLLLGGFGLALCITTQDRVRSALDSELLDRARSTARRPPPPPWMSPPPGFGDGERGGFRRGPGGRGEMTTDESDRLPGGGGQPDPVPRAPFQMNPRADQGPAGPAPGELHERRPPPDGPPFEGPPPGPPDEGGSEHPSAEEPGRAVPAAASAAGQYWPQNPDLRRFATFLYPRFIALDGKGIGPAQAQQPWDPGPVRDAMSGDEIFSNITVERTLVRVVSVPWRDHGRLRGVVQIAGDDSSYRRLVTGQWRTLWTLLPMALLAAIAAGLYLTGRALKPVKEMTHAAAQIGAEDLTRRLEVAGNDEFAELAQTFNAMIARLDDAFERQRRFTADASHELRTPLTHIKLSTSEALSGDHTDDEYRAALLVAERGADIMARLIDQLLTLARSDAGQIAAHGAVLDVEAVLRRAALPFLRRPGARLTLEAPAEQLLVHGDEDHLNRVLSNLLENAFRHTHADGEITLRAYGDPKLVTIQVIDTGEGIPADDVPHVTERFYRVDAARTRSRGGAGLGLAICQEIVQAHGGVLSIDSQPGQGTCVTIKLPRNFEDMEES